MTVNATPARRVAGTRRLRRSLTALLIAVAGPAVVGPATLAADAAPPAPIAAAAQTGVHLPADAAPHHQPTEWWYFSGHLTGTDAAGHVHHYGFEYVTFQFLGVAPAPVYFGNVSITDLDRRTFQYGVREDSYPVPATPRRFALHTGPWTMSGRGGRDVLKAGVAGYSLALRLTSAEPPVLHGKHGVINFGPFGTSKYYSWTDLQTQGTIVDHGVRVRVTGISWMDHQWGAFSFASGGGWDWHSIQLSNGQQYMLYFLRARNGAIVQTVATRIDRGGHAVGLNSAAVSERATGHWTSPRHRDHLSLGLADQDSRRVVHHHPRLRDQELDLRQDQGVVYWEGDVAVHGTIHGAKVHGVGYTEINPPNQP